MTTRPGLEKIEDGYPLSSLQEGMLFHSIADPASGVFINQTVIEIVGDLDVDAFRAAWDRLVARHSVLRTAFLWDGLDQPLQVVQRHAQLEWSEHNWVELPPDDQEDRFAATLLEDRERNFELRNAPLSRMTIIRTAESTWRWIWTCHHLIADGWSVKVLLDELRAIYRETRGRGRATMSEPFAYRDFIAYQLGRDASDDEEFWRARLSGFTSPHRLEVPGFPIDPGARGYRSHSVTLGEAASAALRSAAATEQVTLNTVVLGAWALLLSRWTRETDVVFGATTAGRDTTLPGIERGVGLFINTLPVRVQVSPRRALGDWLRDIQRHQLEAHQFEQSSLAAVQRWSDVPPGEALFESIFVFENQPAPSQKETDDELHLLGAEFIEHSNYPLAVLVLPGESLSVKFVYDTARFATEGIESLAAQLLVVLERLGRDHGGRLSDIRVTAALEERRLREMGAGAPVVNDERCVHEIIEQVASEQSERIAVIFEDQSLTYGDLDHRARQVAARLRSVGVEPNRPVGLFVERSIEMVVGMLGILKAGGAYVPLDPAYPPGHIAGLLADDSIDIVLTDSVRSDAVPGTTTIVVIDGDDASPATDASPSLVGNEDLAYVIHTSGSTSRPKGVMVTHRNLVASTLARDAHYQGPVGRFLLLSSFAFDSSVVGLFWTLCSGGTLILPSPGLEHDIDALMALASDHEITHLLCLPALYELLLENAGEGELASLEVGIVAGEACPPGILESHQQQVPSAELHNEYGPTEATVWCTAHRASGSDRGAALPIGRPIAGARIHLLDEHGNRVPAGFAGELCVAGAGVTCGYLNRPDLTAGSFVTVDIDCSPERLYRTGDLACYRADGALLFLGRADHQLKIRGYRIEAGAVEAALRSHQEVQEAAVTGRSTSGSSPTQLVGYVQAAGKEIDLSELRRYVASSVPDFMVPDRLLLMDELPHLPSGKVDYGALPDQRPGESAGGAFVAPRSPAEATLAAIWSELLGIERISVRDNFFSLGGDSIVSIQMISRSRRAGVHIQPGQITSYPTIEGLVAAATVTGPDLPAQDPVQGLVPLGPIQQWFLNSGLATPEHWNLSGLFEVPLDIDPGILETALQACVDHHDMLRARFENRRGEWHQTVDAERKVRLEVLEVGSGDIRGPIAAVQSELDLERGPLVRGLLLHRGQAATDLLLIAVNHLVVDVVSWGILVEDIETAYRQLAAGSGVELPQRTTAFRDWIRHLGQMDWSGERGFWSAPMPVFNLPVDQPSGDAGRESNSRVLTVRLDRDATRLLLSDAHEAYQTRPEELLVAALAHAAAGWVGSVSVSLVLEGHGRPGDIDGVDLSRSVGWFTARYPVQVTNATADEGELIKSVKEQLRSVPNGGIGYGALRYLDVDEETSGRPDPSILFNYVSRVLEPRTDSLLRWVSSAAETSRNPGNARLHPLEVVAAIRQDRLIVEWQYSDTLFDESTIRILADAFRAHLLKLIEHCMAGDAGGYTPHDFPEAGLDQHELDEFLEGLV